MKKRFKVVFVNLAFVLSILLANAQEEVLTGKVTQNDDDPIPGAAVVVKGTSVGTVTDLNGEFSLHVPSGSKTLVFSFVGMKTKEVEITSSKVYNIILEGDVYNLEEVVAIGYGTMKKSDLTGSVASINSEDINSSPTSTVLQALAGRASGVQVLQNNGQPGGAISVRIRGTNSVQGSNEPLYVVDGFPLAGENPTILSNLDIESIEILKDASATAIYGSRGSNGVVLITTKSGKAGKPSVSIETGFGIQSLRKKLDLMNAKEYAQFYNVVAENDGWDQPAFTQQEVNSFGEGFDWQDYVFGKALLQNHNITVSGGNDKTQFLISGSLYDENGIIENSGYKRYTVRTNIGHDISEKIRVSTNITLAKIYQQNQSSGAYGRGGFTLIGGTLNAFPTVTPTNEDGSWRDLRSIYHWNSEINNPALYINETDSETVSNKVLANAVFEYKPIPELTLRIMGGIENTDNRADYYRTNKFIGLGSRATVDVFALTSLLNENTLTYSKSFGKHSITGLVGFTYQDFLFTSLEGSGTNFLSDLQESHDLGAALVPGLPDSGYSLHTILSGLSRINYTYDDKYFATMSIRADGSSKFSEGNKWGYFPSGSLAWRISNEDFLSDSELLSDLKIRAGWGATGSQAIGTYATLNRLFPGNVVLGGQLYTHFAPGTTLPGDLKWETTEQVDVGVDVGFFENRLHFTADYYSKTTRDLLNTVPLPPSGGYTRTIDNVGVITNKGFELALNADILQGPVKWIVDANISFNKTRIKKLYNGEDIRGTFINITLVEDYFNILREGEPFAAFYGYLDDGYDETGRLGKYKDLTPDGVINALDRTIIGDPAPDFVYGLNSALSYKNFDFTVFIQGSQGNDIYNLSAMGNTLDVGYGGNMRKEVLYDRWTPENPNAKYPTPSRTNGVRVSDRFIEDGSYLRFRNIQLGYNIPLAKLGIGGIKNMQVYVGGKNLITITNYSGWDPEVNSYGGATSFNQGIDYFTYPSNKSVNFGIRVDF